MNESLSKMAYLALRQSYPKGRYKVVKKSYYKPTGKIDWKLLELINPTPSFASHFLVIDQEAANPTRKIINVWIKFCSTGDEVGPKKFDGMVTFTKRELKNILDDRQLHSNIISKGGELHSSSLSFVIFIASHKQGSRIYISDPVISLDLVRAPSGFYDTKWKTQFRENVRAGDPRSVQAGSLFREAKTWVVPDITPYKTNGDNVSIWWRLKAGDPKRVYPYSFSKDEYTELINKIKPEIFDTTVGVCSHASIPDVKRLCFLKLPMALICEVYDNYRTKGRKHHEGIKGKELTLAQVEWIKRNFPDFPLFPVYHWAFNKSPLYYECLPRIT